MSFNATVFLNAKWVPWLLFGVLLIGVLVAVIVYLKNRPKGLAEVKARLRDTEAQAREYHAQLQIERVARERVERERAAFELALLESTHKARIERLSAKEKADYDKVKKNPGSGVAHMRKLLGLGP
jgi:hypothetical protein